MIKSDKKLNCIGFYCPIPIVKTKLEMETMESGDILRVLSDDPGAKNDFPVWCEETGNELIKTEEKDGEFVFYIKKKG